MDIRNRHLQSAAVVATRNIAFITANLHNAIELLNTPGAAMKSTEEAAQLVGLSFAALATVRASQAVHAELVLGAMNGDELEDVRDSLYLELGKVTRGMSMDIATNEQGETIPMGVLSSHWLVQTVDALSQGIYGLETIIATEEAIETMQAAGVDATRPLNDADSDKGNVPDFVIFGGSRHFTSHGESPRAG